jgi:hypothetical protein
MITQEVALLIFNCYREISEGNKMIVELKKSLNDKGEFEIRDNWGNTRGLELHLPTSMSGATIKRLPFELALNVIEKHIEAQHCELERLKEVCRIQLK